MYVHIKEATAQGEKTLSTTKLPLLPGYWTHSSLSAFDTDDCP